MKNPLLSLLAVLMLVCAPLAHAEKADRNKPMHIEADALRHDDLKQVSVFTGNVVVTKGTIVLRGARLEVRQDDAGYQHGTMTADAGKRAFFRQKRDSAPGQPPEFVEGEAEVIEYDARADDVTLRRQAELRRYRGTTLADEIHGAVIVYHNLTDVFTVDGAQGGAGGAGGTRVRAVLTPKDNGTVAPEAAPPGPAHGGKDAKDAGSAVQ